ncbi:hypothetical protein PYW08_010056 [Mythimna loreyi]|uniref:Uncharacterized protein n=1 Tax=Mythimna loreyi TaxID=667449 RepID=A0ACC2Q5J4_9NEOP|nr:hypothetical protein PYW08_010056 [Mythimna loreyi]
MRSKLEWTDWHVITSHHTVKSKNDENKKLKISLRIINKKKFNQNLVLQLYSFQSSSQFWQNFFDLTVKRDVTMSINANPSCFHLESIAHGLELGSSRLDPSKSVALQTRLQ